jgi:hypothetical protein
LLHGYQAGLVVSVIIALLGLLATLWGPVRAHLPARVAIAHAGSGDDGGTETP